MTDWHNVEKQIWTTRAQERLMVFCILDTQMTYDKVCECYNALNAKSMDQRSNIQGHTQDEIVSVLRSAGCRFPNQKAKYIKLFGDNDIDLNTCTRNELQGKVKGVGMKLASMFLNRTRGMQYAILDVHTNNFLKERDLYTGKYEVDEKSFEGIAHSMCMTTSELDNMVWEARRRK